MFPCPFCAGELDQCQHCHGTNVVQLHRCPNQLATRREMDIVTACGLTEQGVLPDPGGWQDQSATFTAAWPIVMHEIRRWRQLAQKLAMDRAGKK
jgi:hypothetical protein